MFTRLGLPMNHYTFSFFLQIARSADFEFEFILYSRNETARHLVRSDFLQRYTQNFEIRRRVPRVKKQQTDENQHTHTHAHTTPLLVEPPMQCLL